MPFIPFLLIVLIAVWIWESHRWIAVLIILACIGLPILLYVSSKQKQEAELARIKEQQELEAAVVQEREALAASFRDDALSIIWTHRATLRRKAEQTIYKDDYGSYVFDRWWAECNYFIENILVRELPGFRYREESAFLRMALNDIALQPTDELPVPEESTANLSPHEFEHLCAKIVRDCGWSARVSKQGADQGVDVIAERDGVRLVLQCKLYGTPVGNAAVQEIIAGKQFEQATFAAVVSNNTFTPAARRLAVTANVELLHVSELQQYIHGLQP